MSFDVLISSIDPLSALTLLVGHSACKNLTLAITIGSSSGDFPGPA